MNYFIDCEFDGHGGALLSFAIVAEDGSSMHIRTTEDASDPWVVENVMPIMECYPRDRIFNAVVPINEVGRELRRFIGGDEEPVIIADSPVDIGRFCVAISTGEDGGWHSSGYENIKFEVRNVDCYPTALDGAVQHNAYWDAMALREKLTKG